MKIKNQTILDKYKQLRDDIDGQCEKLEKEHASHLKCKSGCDLCCMNYNIFPIEFKYILNELKRQQFKMSSKSDAKKNRQDCVFLVDHKCSIYNVRPIICRTHGLPLLYTNNEDEWELSTCELNFQDFEFEQFSEKNTFPQDKFNSKLFLLNRDFIAESPEMEYSELDLISLKELIRKI